MLDRKQLAKTYTLLGGDRVVGRVRSRVARHVPVLAYHRVFEPPDGYPCDPGLVSATPEDFRRQMAFVSRMFDVLSASELADVIRGNRALPARPLVITFDDGFADNYLHAFPILSEYGITATFFLSTEYIDSHKPFWFDALYASILSTPNREIELPSISERLRIGDDRERRGAQAERLLRTAKTVADETRLQLLCELREQLDMNIADEHSYPLSTAQVTEMLEGGMDIGSHTVSHPLLSRIADRKQLDYELSASKATLEQIAGREITTLSYPVGGLGSYNSRVIDAAMAAGYQLAFTYQSGTNRLEDLFGENAFKLKRVHVERETSFDDFRACATWPEVFCYPTDR